MALILCENGASGRLKSDLAAYFKGQNPRFDRGRFLLATERCRR